MSTPTDGPGPAPYVAGGPAPVPQRPGTVTAAGITGIVFGSITLLLALLVVDAAFAGFGVGYGLLVLLSIATSGVMLYAGIQVVLDRSPRLLLLACFVYFGVALVTMVLALAQGAGTGAAIASFLVELVVPGLVVFLLRHPRSRQHYASRGISW